MQLTSFSPRKRFKLFEKVVMIHSIVSPDRVVLVDEDGTQRTFEVATLLIHYQSRNLKGLNSEVTEPTTAHVSVAMRLAEDVSEAAKMRGYARRLYLSAIEREGARLHPDNEVLHLALESVRDTLGEPRVPSIATIRRWQSQARRQGGDPASLIPYFERRGGPGKQRMSTTVKRAVDAVIDNLYLTTERLSASKAYSVLEGQLEERNRWAPQKEQLKVPSYSTFRRRIAQRGAFEVDAARQGAVHALTSYRSTGRNTEVYGLNECWEIDHTWLNLFVIDNENGLGLGRPRFTAIVDHFSRAVMGFDVDFTGTSAQAALNCLKQAILPKTYLREQYPEVQSDWPSHGVPLILKCDNGAEFHSQSLRQTCFELGIDVAYCPLKKPWYKGRIERFFRTFNEWALTSLPGASGSSIKERPAGYDPSKGAVMDLHTLRRHLHMWIVDQYMHHDHGGCHESI